MIRLTRNDGPSCPACGCQDARIVRESVSRGTRSKQCLCRHCGRAFFQNEPADPPAKCADLSEPVEAPVIYHLVHCPGCGSTDTYVTSTVRPVRRHLCRGCGKRFKSCEE